MAIFVFALALILALSGAGALLLSIDLVPTEVGLLYAGCGVVALSSACVVAAIGALVVRVDRVGARVRQALLADQPPAQVVAPAAAYAAPPVVEPEPIAPHIDAEAAPDPYEFAAEAEEPLNENRAGHLPTLEEIEETIAHPEPPPRLIGRYSAGGANYAIFSDGSVEADMAEGQYNFPTMSDFRAFLEGRRLEGSA